MLRLNPNRASLTDPTSKSNYYDLADGTFGAGIIDLDNTLIYVGGQSDVAMRSNSQLAKWNEQNSNQIDLGKLFYKRLFLVKVKFKEASINKGKYTVLPDIVNPMWQAGSGPDPKTFLGANNMNGLNLGAFSYEKLSIPDTTFEVVKNDDGDGLSDGFDLWIFQQAGSVYVDTSSSSLYADRPHNVTENYPPGGGSIRRYRTPISTPEQLQSGGGIRIKLAIVYNEE